jgi:hypothetical protein
VTLARGRRWEAARVVRVTRCVACDGVSVAERVVRIGVRVVRASQQAPRF